jgi:hypothetical protein
MHFGTPPGNKPAREKPASNNHTDDKGYDTDSSDGYVQRASASQRYVDPSWLDNHDLLLKGWSEMLCKRDALSPERESRK